jgi:hypothetical protein
MNWHWAPHVHAAMHGDDLVVLDVRRNDYLLLAAVGDAVQLAPDSNAAQIHEDDLVNQLEAARLGARSQGVSPTPRNRAPSADHDLFDQSVPTLRIAQVAALAALSAHVSQRLRWTPMSRLVRSFPVHDGGDVSEVVQKALVLRAALPWLPLQGECLYRAALLRAHLGRLAGHTHCVFGVSTWPFSAHCWVQWGGVVLNDRLQRVRRFTPILAV